VANIVTCIVWLLAWSGAGVWVLELVPLNAQIPSFILLAMGGAASTLVLIVNMRLSDGKDK